jgi:hypothetical protein
MISVVEFYTAKNRLSNTKAQLLRARLTLRLKSGSSISIRESVLGTTSINTLNETIKGKYMSMDRIIEPKKGLKRKHIFWGFGGMLFIAVLAKVIFGNNSSAYRTDAERLTVSTVEEGFLTTILQL